MRTGRWERGWLLGLVGGQGGGPVVGGGDVGWWWSSDVATRERALGDDVDSTRLGNMGTRMRVPGPWPLAI